MQVAILGPLEVTQGAQPVEVNGARLRALLARLALDPGRVLTPDTLVASLWEDDEPSDAANALQSLVSRLRRALPDDRLQSRPGGYVLDVGTLDVDAARFEELARAGRTCLQDGDVATAAATLRDALALWRGPALADVGAAPFASAPAARLDELRLGAIEDRIEADLALGRHGDVVPELEALVADHPLRERLTLLLVTALAGSGRSAEALAAYERTRAVLTDELGTDPSQELRDLHTAVLRGEVPVVAVAPPPAKPRPRTNLPAALTSFVGRDAELERIAELLGEHRLVTLVGPGGAGKTRLACEGAAAAVANEPVWLVELAPVTAAADIPQAALGVLDLRETNVLDTRRSGPSQDAFARLVSALRTGPALVVLDNCEHLIEGAAVFADRLLAQCPQLRIVATSREPLGITGEMLCPVPPLGLPQPDVDVSDAASYPALSLFVDRAHAVAPDFALDADTLPHVVEICRRLDGQPLAIELAAARMRTMPVATLAARLDDRFRLLTGGSRTAVARHRTLRAVVEWSWDLLGDPERRLVEVVAVFPAGATAVAIHAVATSSGATTDDLATTEDLLDELATKSLLQVGAAIDGTPRYRMLETIREFGVEQLIERADVVAVRRAHATYYRDLVERIEPLLRTADQLRWLAELEQERDNVLGALRFAADDGDADTALRIAAGLAWFWWSQGTHAEVTMWVGLALRVPGEQPDEARGVAIVVYAMSGWESGVTDPELPPLVELLSTLPEVDPLTSHPLLAVVAPIGAMLAGDSEGTERALAHNLGHPDPWARATLHMIDGLYGENSGDIHRQRQSFEKARELFEQVGERWGLGTVLTALGGLRELDGDLDGAHEALDAALVHATEIRAVDDRAQIMTRLAMVDLRREQPEEAIRHLDAARELAETTGGRQALSIIETTTAAIALRRGDHATARAQLTSAAARFSDDSPGGAVPQITSIVHSMMSALAVAEGDLATAHAELAVATRLSVDEGDIPVIAIVTVHAAHLAMAEGDTDAARDLLAAATTIRGADDPTDPLTREVRTWLAERAGPDAVARTVDGLREGRPHAMDVLTAYTQAEGEAVPD